LKTISKTDFQIYMILSICQVLNCITWNIFPRKTIKSEQIISKSDE
jgi:hypothetical protein